MDNIEYKHTFNVTLSKEHYSEYVLKLLNAPIVWVNSKGEVVDTVVNEIEVIDHQEIKS